MNTTTFGRKITCELRSTLLKCHNKQLCKEPIVYHIYNDGTITRQKGGEIYGWRTEFTEFDPRTKDQFVTFDAYDFCFNKNVFPLQKFNKYGYAITTLDDAIRLRELMLELKLKYEEYEGGQLFAL